MKAQADALNADKPLMRMRGRTMLPIAVLLFA
jgi:hypothetical protein